MYLSSRINNEFNIDHFLIYIYINLFIIVELGIMVVITVSNVLMKITINDWVDAST